MRFENQLHTLRKQCNLSQEQLAEQVGVTRQTISKWELGETAPDIKQAQRIADIFHVSMDELLGRELKETVVTSEDSPIKQASPWRKVIAISIALVCVCAMIAGAWGITKRAQLLHPNGIAEPVEIFRKNAIRIGEHYAKTVVYREKNKPVIICELPEGFSADGEDTGLYTDGDGNFIIFSAEYSETVANPLIGTVYYPYYAEKGYRSYIEMANASMYYDYPQYGIFASANELHLAGGAMLFRQWLCAGQDAEYYAVSGGLLPNCDEMRIQGFALHFGDAVWKITLRDYEDNYYFITVKDPSGIGETIDTIGEFLSSVYAGDTERYSNALDSAAVQSAKNAYTNYVIEQADSGEEPGGFVYQAENFRFVAIYDGNTAGVYNNIEDALSALTDNPDISKLHSTGIEHLWKYMEDSN